MSNRKYYLVGGAVRDGLLDYPYSEKDWVVTGASEKEMLNEGFKKVGKDFPVFLHPETKEEYALARTERKSGHGYHGFDVNAEPSVTLEDDLSRRDLTINAMAQDENGQLIDPFNGSADLKMKKLRHISPAFAEDPVRVLRVARFAARYHHLGFTVADETITLMQQMVTEGEVEHLVAERVWQEMHKALTEKDPQVFIAVLRETGALKVIMPEIDVLFGIPNPVQWHPEIDTGLHSLMVLEQAAKLTELPLVRFAALCHDLGKGITPEKFWPKHRGHEEAGVKVIKRLCERLKPPKEFINLACLGSRYHLHAHKAFELKPTTLLKLFQAFDLFRRPELFSYYLDICEADYRGRGGFERFQYPQRKYMTEIARKVSSITTEDIKVASIATEGIIKEGLSGKEIGNAINKKRIQLITNVKKQFGAKN